MAPLNDKNTIYRRYSIEQLCSMRTSLLFVNCPVRKFNQHPDITAILRLPAEVLRNPDVNGHALTSTVNQIKARGKQGRQGSDKNMGTSSEDSSEFHSQSSRPQVRWHLRPRPSSDHNPQPHSAPTNLFSQQSENFQKFYRAVVSPTHVRVTAGGRIVPNTRHKAPPAFDWNPELRCFESNQSPETRSEVLQGSAWQTSGPNPPGFPPTIQNPPSTHDQLTQGNLQKSDLLNGIHRLDIYQPFNKPLMLSGKPSKPKLTVPISNPAMFDPNRPAWQINGPAMIPLQSGFPYAQGVHGSMHYQQPPTAHIGIHPMPMINHPLITQPNGQQLPEGMQHIAPFHGQAPVMMPIPANAPIAHMAPVAPVAPVSVSERIKTELDAKYARLHEYDTYQGPPRLDPVTFNHFRTVLVHEIHQLHDLLNAQEQQERALREQRLSRVGGLQGTRGSLNLRAEHRGSSTSDAGLVASHISSSHESNSGAGSTDKGTSTGYSPVAQSARPVTAISMPRLSADAARAPEFKPRSCPPQSDSKTYLTSDELNVVVGGPDPPHGRYHGMDSDQIAEDLMAHGSGMEGWSKSAKQSVAVTMQRSRTAYASQSRLAAPVSALKTSASSPLPAVDHDLGSFDQWPDYATRKKAKSEYFGGEEQLFDYASPEKTPEPAPVRYDGQSNKSKAEVVEAVPQTLANGTLEQPPAFKAPLTQTEPSTNFQLSVKEEDIPVFAPGSDAEVAWLEKATRPPGVQSPTAATKTPTKPQLLVKKVEIPRFVPGSDAEVDWLEKATRPPGVQSPKVATEKNSVDVMAPISEQERKEVEYLAGVLETIPVMAPFEYGGGLGKFALDMNNPGTPAPIKFDLSTPANAGLLNLSSSTTPVRKSPPPSPTPKGKAQKNLRVKREGKSVTIVTPKTARASSSLQSDENVPIKDFIGGSGSGTTQPSSPKTKVKHMTNIFNRLREMTVSPPTASTKVSSTNAQGELPQYQGSAGMSLSMLPLVPIREDSTLEFETQGPPPPMLQSRSPHRSPETLGRIDHHQWVREIASPTRGQSQHD